MRPKPRTEGRATHRGGEPARCLERLGARRAWVLLGAIAGVALAACSAEPPRNAIVVVVDGLRADRLSCYGNPTETTPAIDSLAREGVLFETVVSNAPSTLPAMIGLLTGDLPTRRLYSNGLQSSLVERIRDAGFLTAAFAEGPVVSRRNGLDRGFETFADPADSGDPGAAGGDGVERTFARALAFIRSHRDRRFFVLIHTRELQPPFRRMDFTGGLDPGALGETFDEDDADGIALGRLPFGPLERTYLRALYDGGIRTVDRHMQELLDALDELGLRDRTAIVVTGNHGEDLGGRDPERPGAAGHHVYDELLLVPLVVFDPTRRYDVSRVTSLARTIDTLPTLVDLLGIPERTHGYGRSLLPVMRGEDASPVGAWIRAASEGPTHFVERHALRTQTHKLIMTFEIGQRFRTEVYDLVSDPGERVDLSRSDRPLRMSLQRELLKIRRALARDGLIRFVDAPASPGERAGAAAVEPAREDAGRAATP